MTQVVTWWCIASLSAPRLVVFYVLVAIQEDSGACDLPGLTVDSIYLDANFVNQASHVFLGYRVGSLYGWVYNNATSYRCPPEGVYGYYWGRQDAVNTAPGFNNIDLHQNWILPPDPKPPVYFGGYCLATV